jgi:hypothetical protein
MLRIHGDRSSLLAALTAPRSRIMQHLWLNHRHPAQCCVHEARGQMHK